MRILDQAVIQDTNDFDSLLFKWKLAWENTLTATSIWEPELAINACEKFLISWLEKKEFWLEKILSTGTALNLAQSLSIWSDVNSFLSQKNLTKKLERELCFPEPFQFRKIRNEDVYEAWTPLGVILHITPRNAPLVSFFTAIEGLLSGNINIVKLASDSAPLSEMLLAELAKDENAKMRIYCIALPSTNTLAFSALISEVDAVSVWGSEESCAAIRKLTPSGVRSIEWGHKLSFGFISKNALRENSWSAERWAKSICEMDQLACSSPQTLFVETENYDDLEILATQIAVALDRQLQIYPGQEASGPEAAEISKTKYIHLAESCLRPAKTLTDSHGKWMILVDSETGLRASPLYRTIFIKPLLRKDIIPTLRPLRNYLQSVGLDCSLDEIPELVVAFTKAGCNRVRTSDEMLSGYPGEPHDGVYALQRFCNRVSVSVANIPSSISDLNELELTKKATSHKKMILHKDDFQRLSEHHLEAPLVFKSGGSSGEPKLSVFTYHDYHSQMRHAADGLLAAGFDPKKDRAMNLFFSGGLYGGFLSFFSILEDLRAPQLPMAASLDFAFVKSQIQKTKVNTLMGMPSYIEQLLAAEKDFFSSEKPIKKIFFGGEHLSLATRKRYKVEFGVELIRSASYGSVDAGPIGYQCEFCEGSVHHLHSRLQSLEILELDSDIAVEGEDIGRMVLTSKMRSALPLERYEIGDLGRWIKSACQCGRKHPRFELLGRFGDVFRSGGAYFNVGRFRHILETELNYSHELQALLDQTFAKAGAANKLTDSLTVLISESASCTSEEAKKVLLSHDHDLCEIVKEGSLMFEVKKVYAKDFIRTDGSGKLKSFIDQRQW